MASAILDKIFCLMLTLQLAENVTSVLRHSAAAVSVQVLSKSYRSDESG